MTKRPIFITTLLGSLRASPRHWSGTTRSFITAGAVALILAISGLFSPEAQAAVINYGDFNVPAAGITFTQVTESSSTDPVPLYGAPDPFLVGLDFDPTSFGAFSAGGGADITDGQLNFGVTGAVSPLLITTIDSISLSELGDFTLVGGGTPATSVFAGAILRVKVTHIDGIDVPDINLLPINGSVGFNLIANPGIVQPWGLGVLIDVEAQLIALAVPFNFGATKVEVVINNSLIAISEPASVAAIAKKDFVIDIVPEEHIVPEPATLLLMGIGVLALSPHRRRA